ncbi:MAG: hypothetical protein JWN10_2071 [Solirubrobacterales bacterium]|nr:hypothetical protein [Solirubrobacterales bacterium]
MPPLAERCGSRADVGTRTRDPLLTMEVLYQLSYVGADRILALRHIQPHFATSPLRAGPGWALPAGQEPFSLSLLLRERTTPQKC